MAPITPGPPKKSDELVPERAEPFAFKDQNRTVASPAEYDRSEEVEVERGIHNSRVEA